MPWIQTNRIPTDKTLPNRHSQPIIKIQEKTGLNTYETQSSEGWRFLNDLPRIHMTRVLWIACKFFFPTGKLPFVPHGSSFSWDAKGKPGLIASKHFDSEKWASRFLSSGSSRCQVSSSVFKTLCNLRQNVSNVLLSALSHLLGEQFG
jgi:hypothetical protein